MISNKVKGRGSQIQLDNPFESKHLTQEHLEGVDEWEPKEQATKLYIEHPKNILSKNSSPDIPFEWSINPYQGCEHGCIYCYARNSHNYWGFNAGQDFESKIVIKKNAAEKLSESFSSKSWKPSFVFLSGNTDCYQPLERKWKITRSLLKVFLNHRNPVGIITKNALILRDLDLLEDLSQRKLLKVVLSITSMDEKLRRKMEPRTSTIAKKLEAIEKLRERNIPVSILIGPVIPGLNDHEIPDILKACGNAGAMDAGYTMLRLNGQLNQVFEHWLKEEFPNKFDKVLNQVKSLHDGKLNDSAWGRRMGGEGLWADTVKKLFNQSKKRYLDVPVKIEYDFKSFRRIPIQVSFDF